MKRIITASALLALALGLIAGCGARSDAEAVPVESVAMIAGRGTMGMVDSFAGKVVSGETAELKRDADKTVLEVRVQEGDMVREGDTLFVYDTEAMQLSLDKLYLDLESYDNTITAAKTEIEQLESERSKASSSQQLSYTLQIDARAADIREAEYNKALKEKEIASMEAAMENTEVTSPISGRVMKVGSVDGADSGNMDTGGDSGSGAFITVMDVSAYRVEGKINELNVGSIVEGMPVLVRSRMDAADVWHGTIDKIDWENPVSNNNQMYYGGGGDEMTSSSKYPFYIALDRTDGLLLGQHVYIEPDYGQDDAPDALMLPAYYIADADGSPYVWAASAADKLEKRPVTLGAFDEDLYAYEVLSGLADGDYIAFPAEELAEGQPVAYYDESSFGGGDVDLGDGLAYESEPFDMGGEVFEDKTEDYVPEPLPEEGLGG